MRCIRQSGRSASSNGRRNVRLDRFTGIDETIERLSSDDVATPKADCIELAIMNRLLDGSTLTGAILGGGIDVETASMRIRYFGCFGLAYWFFDRHETRLFFFRAASQN